MGRFVGEWVLVGENNLEVNIGVLYTIQTRIA